MSWNPAYIVLILISTFVDYFAAIKMSEQNTKNKRRKYLYLSLIANLGLLFIFKYFNFFNDSVRLLFESLGVNYGVPSLSLLLPVGISFYTFQTLSYTIDVYKGVTKPEKHFGIFAVYVSFFPQLVAGPIERSERLLPQFHKTIEPSEKNFSSGLKMMVWGFFKKVVIADNVAVIVNNVYNNVNEFQGLPLIIATFLFAIQIYCDFSGYSDIAIGSARVMGIDLMKNFNTPYFSKSISEFWKRWHISLSTWFRDYVYIPLGGNRVSKPRHYLNLFLTFLISGLWHGANWTFVIWGALHGGFIMIENAFSELFRKKERKKKNFIINALKMLVTFILVNFAWIFFRANSLKDAFYVVSNLFTGLNNQLNSIESLKRVAIDSGFGIYSLFVSIFSIFILTICDLSFENSIGRNSKLFNNQYSRFFAIYSLTMIILLLGNYGSAEFIYFQF
jgi:D-alanyl-lipoteichoic acid acyltransferase DltB (MBOAT superfamily)